MPVELELESNRCVDLVPRYNVLVVADDRTISSHFGFSCRSCRLRVSEAPSFRIQFVLLTLDFLFFLMKLGSTLLLIL